MLANLTPNVNWFDISGVALLWQSKNLFLVLEVGCNTLIPDLPLVPQSVLHGFEFVLVKHFTTYTNQSFSQEGDAVFPQVPSLEPLQM